MLDENGKEYRTCIVGNIIGDHYWGQQKEIKKGLKHFRAGAKVYCVFMYAGMGHERVRVMGKPRKSFRMIDIIIDARYIKNYRLQKVFEPRILQFLKKYPDSANAEDLLWLAETFNTSHVEIKKDIDT